jgi:hypothetical protein
MGADHHHEAKPDMAAAEEDVAVDEELASAEEVPRQIQEMTSNAGGLSGTTYSFHGKMVSVKLLCDACLFL